MRKSRRGVAECGTRTLPGDLEHPNQMSEDWPRERERESEMVVLGMEGKRACLENGAANSK